jgi:hypothetical protein
MVSLVVVRIVRFFASFFHDSHNVISITGAIEWAVDASSFYIHRTRLFAKTRLNV